MKLRTGVYAIVCTKTGRVYIGSTSRSFSGRWSQHKRELRRGKHSNRFLQASWNKYGEQCFSFVVMLRCEPADCVQQEQKLIDCMNVCDRRIGFNLCPRAGSVRGLKHTAETIERIRQLNRGRKQSPEEIERRACQLRGRKRSPEVCARISEAIKGRKMSQAFKDACRKRRLGAKQTPEAIAKTAAANRGRRHSPDTLNRLSAIAKAKGIPRYVQESAWAANRGRKQPPEIVEQRASKLRGRKMPADAIERSAAKQRGRKRTPEQCRRNSQSQLGKKLSEEHKKKLSIANKGKCYRSKESYTAAADKSRGWKHTDESREKMRLSHIGQKLPEEQKRRIRESCKLRCLLKKASRLLAIVT